MNCNVKRAWVIFFKRWMKMIEVTAEEARNKIYSFLDKSNKYLDSIKGRYEQMKI